MDTGPATEDTPAAEDGQIALVAALKATGVPVITLAVRNPYDVARLPVSTPRSPRTAGRSAHCAPPPG